MSLQPLVWHKVIRYTIPFLWQDLSVSTKMFDLATLTLTFNLHFENFNLDHNIWTVTDRTSICHMYIPCDKTFLLKKNLFTLMLPSGGHQCFTNTSWFQYSFVDAFQNKDFPFDPWKGIVFIFAFIFYNPYVLRMTLNKILVRPYIILFTEWNT